MISLKSGYQGRRGGEGRGKQGKGEIHAPAQGSRGMNEGK